MQKALKNIHKPEEIKEWLSYGSFQMHHNKFQVWAYKENILHPHAASTYDLTEKRVCLHSK